MKLLIVEDYYVDRFMIKKILMEEGFNENQIYISEDGKQAIKKIKNDRPDIIFLDITIPYYNGVEILKYIDENIENYNPLVIIITNNDNEEIILKTKKYNANAYAIKPLSMDDLKKIFLVIKIVFIEQRFEYINYEKF